MIKLIWFVVTLSATGPVSGEIPDRVFTTPAECEAFATKMTPRMEDWVRGFFQAEWNHPVKVNFRCDAGSPT